MAERDTAEAQLQRILCLLPVAGEDDGASIRQLADTLGVSETQVVRDATVLTERAFYHPAGGATESQLLIENDRITLLVRSRFARPPRFTAAEVAALGLGLRILSADAEASRAARLLDLAARLEAHLALPGATEREPLTDAAPAQQPAGAVLDVAREAVRRRCPCMLLYLKPSGTAPTPRVVLPYAVAQRERWWYLVGHCTLRGEVRAFRLDRVLEAACEPGEFEVPADFDAHAWLAGARLLHPATAPEPTAVVRYSARIAPWIAEQWPEAQANPNGALLVRHRVLDEDWLVRHVLQYGAEAEVLEPSELRARVRTAAEAVAAVSTAA